MPIRPENKALYPADWRLISREIRARAHHRCENCGIRNYSVGYREAEGRFRPLAGSGPCDCAGEGLVWPSLEPITYGEAKEFADAANTCSDRRDEDGNRWFVIVLTVAHLDHDPRNCDRANLKALCQACHLGYDAEHHAETAARTRKEGKAVGDLFDNGSAP